MSGRLAEVAAHLDTTHELGAVIGAMRGIAAARSREAQQSLAAVRDYAETLGMAIGEALALSGQAPAAGSAHPDGWRHVVLALCAEQGFVGGYNERVLEAARGCCEGQVQELWLLGARGAQLAEERGFETAWTGPMAVHLDDMPALAGQLAEALFARLDARPLCVTLVHAQPGAAGQTHILARRLLPFDYGRFPLAERLQPPYVTLAPAALVAGLADEYVFAELYEALVLAYAAENEARMQAMIGAQGNLQRREDELTAEFRRLRQDEITEEIIELTPPALSGGPSASASSR